MDKDLTSALSILEQELKKKVKNTNSKDHKEFLNFLDERITHSNDVIIKNMTLLEQLKKDACSEGKIDLYLQNKIEGAENAANYWKLCKDILQRVRESLVAGDK